MVVGQVPQRSHPERARREDHQLLAGLRLGRGRSGEHPRGQHPLRQVVHAGEVVRPPPRGDPTGPEQPFERLLGVIPVPPGAFGDGALRQVAGHDRAAVDDRLVDALDVAGALLVHPHQPAPRRPFRGPGHLPAEQVVLVDGDVRRLVSPVLEQLAIGRGLRQQVPWMGTEAGEQRQFLGAHQDVHRVDLDEPHAIENPPQVTAIDPSVRSRRRRSPAPRERSAAPGRGRWRWGAVTPRSVGNVDGDGVDDDVLTGAVIAVGGHLLHGLDDVHPLDHLAEQ